MPRNKQPLLGLIGLIGLWGCASSAPRAVWVDLSQLDQPAPRSLPIPAPPAAIQPTAQTVSFAGLPERELFLGDREERFRVARREVRANLRRAYEEVRADFLAGYLGDVREFETRERDDISARERASLEAWSNEVRGVFERIAPLIGTHRFALANLVGFPDPDPDSKRVPLEADRFAQRPFEESKGHRKAIMGLSEEFWKEVASLRSGIEAAAQDDRTRLEVRLAQLEQDAVRRASADAASLTRSDEGEDPMLGPKSTRVPAEAGASAPVLASGARSLPVVPLGSPIARHHWLVSRAKLWAAIHHYQLVDQPRQGADKTREFAVWLDQGR